MWGSYAGLPGRGAVENGVVDGEGGRFVDCRGGRMGLERLHGPVHQIGGFFTFCHEWILSDFRFARELYADRGEK